jgi:hypothetical protein
MCGMRLGTLADGEVLCQMFAIGSLNATDAFSLNPVIAAGDPAILGPDFGLRDREWSGPVPGREIGLAGSRIRFVVFSAVEARTRA